MSADAAAETWVEHLRSGGVTPWAQWWPERRDLHLPGETATTRIPGAHSLELLRMLNQAGRPDPALVERVLRASPVGRGRTDLGLLTDAGQPMAGDPLVDPAELSNHQMLRVLVGLLAEDLVATGTTPPPEPWRPGQPAPGRRPRPWHPHYRLVGDESLAAPLRRQLIAAGRHPGGRRAQVYVVGTDLASMLSHTWVRNSLRDRGDAWRHWLRRQARADRLAPRADLASIAHWWARRVGHDRVTIVLDRSRLREATGLRRLDLRVDSLPHPLVADLGRRVGRVLGGMVLPHDRARLLQQVLAPSAAPLLPWPMPYEKLPVPEVHREWLTRQAETVQRRIAQDRYAVWGDPAALLPPRSPEGVSWLSSRTVLDLGLRLLLTGVGGVVADGRRSE